MAYIKEYASPPSTGFQGAVFTHVRHVLTRVVALSLLWYINMAALTSCVNDLYLLILWRKSNDQEPINDIIFKWNVFGTYVQKLIAGA